MQHKSHWAKIKVLAGYIASGGLWGFGGSSGEKMHPPWAVSHKLYVMGLGRLAGGRSPSQHKMVQRLMTRSYHPKEKRASER